MLSAASTTVQAQPLTAFPGAEGAGKWTIGGRAGRVIAVTNLNDAGTGSLRSAIDATGPRTIVFRTAGTIWLKSLLVVRNPYLTISGHTAPGDGITIAGHEFRIQASEVIVRYLRFRLGDLRRADLDAVSIMRGKNIILDHVSASWGIDEVLSVTPDARDVTVQWSLIAESLYRSVHSSGEPHGKGSLLRGTQRRTTQLPSQPLRPSLRPCSDGARPRPGGPGPARRAARFPQQRHLRLGRCG